MNKKHRIKETDILEQKIAALEYQLSETKAINNAYAAKIKRLTEAPPKTEWKTHPLDPDNTYEEIVDKEEVDKEQKNKK